MFSRSWRARSERCADALRAPQPARASSPVAAATAHPTAAIRRERTSAAPEQPAHCGHHLFGALTALGRFGTDHARVRVAVEEPERHLVECGLGGADLGEDVDAVAVVLDHPFDPADLALDPLQARQQLVLRCRVPARWCLRLRHGVIVAVLTSTP